MISFAAPGARSNAASLKVTSVSTRVMPFTVTLPLFVTTTLYVTVSPTFTLLSSEVFVTVSSALTTRSNLRVRTVSDTARVAESVLTPSFSV